MTLNEFITKRLNELGKNRNQLSQDADIAWSTLLKISNGMIPKRVTLEKLAKGLQCTQGELQKCLAEQNPLKDIVVNKKSLAKLTKAEPKPEAPAPDPVDEEPAEVFQPEPEPEDEVDMMFPDEPKREEEPPEEKTNDLTEKLTDQLINMGVKSYQQKLKDKVGEILASTQHKLTESVKEEIGEMLLQELWGKSK